MFVKGAVEFGNGHADRMGAQKSQGVAHDGRGGADFLPLQILEGFDWPGYGKKLSRIAAVEPKDFVVPIIVGQIGVEEIIEYPGGFQRLIGEEGKVKPELLVKRPAV